MTKRAGAVAEAKIDPEEIERMEHYVALQKDIEDSDITVTEADIVLFLAIILSGFFVGRQPTIHCVCLTGTIQIQPK